jgi:hypothetical protein
MHPLIQGQGLLVLSRHIQRNFCIAVAARLLLRRLQQARADAPAAPGGEHRQRIDIPLVLLCLVFELPANGRVQPLLLSPSKAQDQPDHLATLLGDLYELIAKSVAHLSEEVP